MGGFIHASENIIFVTPTIFLRIKKKLYHAKFDFFHLEDVIYWLV